MLHHKGIADIMKCHFYVVTIAMVFFSLLLSKHYNEPMTRFDDYQHDDCDNFQKKSD